MRRARPDREVAIKPLANGGDMSSRITIRTADRIDPPAGPQDCRVPGCSPAHTSALSRPARLFAAQHADAKGRRSEVSPSVRCLAQQSPQVDLGSSRSDRGHQRDGGRGMSGEHQGDTCPFCKRGALVRQCQEIAFRQWTSRGYVFCRITVPMDVCASCGSKIFTDRTESLIEDAVRRESERLP
jgi:hypothetical protein